MVKNFRNQQKIKDKQINFLLGDLEKNLEQYKESLENKEKQFAEAKRILLSAKKSFDKLNQENRDLKEYIAQIKNQFQQENKKQQEFLKQQQSFYENVKPKKYKKVILEEESENESEPKSEEETNFETEETEETPQVKKPRKKNKSSNVFEYINQNAKRHKR